MGSTRRPKFTSSDDCLHSRRQFPPGVRHLPELPLRYGVIALRAIHEEFDRLEHCRAAAQRWAQSRRTDPPNPTGRQREVRVTTTIVR